jgi:hypothetical protein
MKTVFILGAGASVATGAPLMPDFLKTARRLHVQGLFTAHDAAFRDVIQAADQDLRAMYAKSHLQLENIEELFSAIEMGRLIGRFGARDQASIENLRNSIAIFIFRTIEETVKFRINGNEVSAPPGYGPLADELGKSAKQTVGRGFFNYSFITFNYDVALEAALHRVGLSIDYCLKEQFCEERLNAFPVKVPVLKLHGSINWGWCSRCKTICPTNVVPLGHILPIDLKEWKLRLGSEIPRYSHQRCGQALDPVPFLVPPTWNKGGANDDLAGVWRRAAKELADADNIVVIGYSFPPTDTFFKYLYALGINSEKRLDKFIVINGERGREVQPHFEQLKGAITRDVFKFHHVVFTGAINIIRDVLAE